MIRGTREYEGVRSGVREGTRGLDPGCEGVKSGVRWGYDLKYEGVRSGVQEGLDSGYKRV